AQEDDGLGARLVLDGQGRGGAVLRRARDGGSAGAEHRGGHEQDGQERGPEAGSGACHERVTSAASVRAASVVVVGPASAVSGWTSADGDCGRASWAASAQRTSSIGTSIM